jgi:hypothetical protein
MNTACFQALAHGESRFAARIRLFDFNLRNPGSLRASATIVQEFPNHALFPAGDRFNAPVITILNPPAHPKPVGDPLGGSPKEHALHVPADFDPKGLHIPENKDRAQGDTAVCF